MYVIRTKNSWGEGEEGKGKVGSEVSTNNILRQK
jgi:hypothetical protein